MGPKLAIFCKCDNTRKKKKIKEKLERDKGNAFMSRDLVTINTNMNLEFGIDSLKLRKVDNSKIKKTLNFEFNDNLTEEIDSIFNLLEKNKHLV